MDPESSTCIRRNRARPPLNDLALVLTAVGIDHEIEFDGHDWSLWVLTGDVVAANAELDSYQRENRGVVHRVREVQTIDSGWFGVLGYLLAIWALPSLEGAEAFGWNWRENGVMDATRVTQGEWWRTVTALTLHGDLAHLMSNSAFGAVFGLFVGRYLGSGLGWLLVLLAAACGNGINAFVQNSGFRSVGASTATFAALALVGAFVWRRGYTRGWDWRRRFAPVFGGVALLAYTGFGGGNTDVMAHVTGFGCGLALGLVTGSVDVRVLGRSGQWLCAGLTVGLVVWAWALAGWS
ncbi:MAG: rhomboid family intramembrane serine protease [Pseudomonadales bacterium]